MLNLARSSCNLLLQIIEQTTELQKIKQGKFTINEVEFNLRKEILGLLDIFKVQAEFKSLQLLLDIE